ncbi:MAG: hypothetical protein ACM3NQ_04575 [Bacteroidales bacterium]
MKHRKALLFAVVGLAFVVGLVGQAAAQDQKPTVKIPDPGVPQIMTMEGQFVRAAYNNEGYVILGYKIANMNIGNEYLMLEIGATVRDGVKNYTLLREHVSMETPDGKTVPLASVEEYRAGNVRNLEMQANTVRDSINYFPPSATRACRIGFFAPLGGPAMPYDQVELSNTRACLGRVFFKVPGGVTYGQHWLNVKFQGSVIRVPFKILTKDEEKFLSKNYKDISKQVKEAFAPPKKK